MNCKGYSFFEGVSSDRRIVTAKLRLSLRQTSKSVPYNWPSHAYIDICGAPPQTLKNNLLGLALVKMG